MQNLAGTGSGTGTYLIGFASPVPPVFIGKHVMFSNVSKLQTKAKSAIKKW